ncbi:hypothetical protein GCM10010172_22690 [Paractinoplanes ferrugineus]|uniref:PET hydrolase/cutinase-like domain-containing protein n=1 Tax=Paractinoplanes ferrugineus TaxID=113564 RepID=A0A919MDS6_9ACTN|nr:dienelactone hydrolase family protein [Actinoplanes ferrugineus]GIE08820.1 hypothetical protein Afe05nite_06600 [Actinoplanes ferrugineus]
MGRRRFTFAAVALAVALTAGGCSGAAAGPPTTAPAPPAAVPAVPEHQTYPVGFRTLDLHRGPGRPLPTLVFYPALSSSPGERTTGHRAEPANGLFVMAGGRSAARRDGTLPPITRIGPAAYPELVARLQAVATAGTPPAAGRFPLVLFSHGLFGSAERYAAVAAQLASAGFVVAAPTYPYTSEFAPRFRRSDLVHQPADARFVLTQVLRLDQTAGDPLRRRIDTEHIAAVGHSAGGYTTTGLFVAGHDPRLRAGVVMAGWAAAGAFAGPPATMLFLQGTSDPVVPRTVSHAAWLRVPWTKAYVLLRGNSHSTYLQPGDLGYATMLSTVTDFLRWTLGGDETARKPLPSMVKATAGTQGTHS